MKYRISFLLTLLLLLASCQQELPPVAGGGTTGRGHISFNVAPMKSGNTNPLENKDFTTRAVTEDAVKRVDAVVFEKVTGTLLGIFSSSTANSNDFSTPFTGCGGNTCNIYFIANLKAAPTNITNEAAFKKSDCGLATYSQEDVTTYGIPMCGSLLGFKMPIDGIITNTPITLARLLAKVAIVYTSDVPAQFTATSLEVCNVPNITPYYSDVTTAPSTYYTPAMPVSNFIGKSSTLPNGTYTYYLPANRRGRDGTNTNPRTKLGKNITTPTSVKISDGLYTYTFFLGGNDHNDYNLLANTSYTVNATIKGISLADERVVDNAMSYYSNCYIVSPGNFVTINARIVDIARNRYPTANIPALPASCSASVLWQTSPNANYITVGACSNGVFTVTANQATPGNAVVCIKNGSSILWSWHIWVTGYNPVATVKPYNGLNFMDRNLGATEVAPATTAPTLGSYGLYYQWGRKDPFGGPSSTASSTPLPLYTGVSANSRYTVPVPTNDGTIAKAVLNPSTFYTGSNDWNATRDDTLWGAGTKKSVFDPCPLGWRVPIYNGAVSCWDGLSTDNFPWNPTAKCRTVNSNSYPASGYLNTSGGIDGAGTFGFYWSGSVSYAQASYMYFNSDILSPSFNYGRTDGKAVRCVQE